MLQRNVAKPTKALSSVDIMLFVFLFLLIYGLVGVAHEWTGPFRPKTEISLGVPALLWYALLSLVRVSIAYILSLVFALFYGYAAAKSRRLEMVLIPILDILQSVPVLGFMPGLVLAFVTLFPQSNFGLELAAVIMIFTGEGWNLVFSFYSSLRGVPTELSELGELFHMRELDRLRDIELPFAMNGLVWNSMLSMAGGWFFLMTIESFSLGAKDFRLPGIGSYMAVAYEQQDYRAVMLGIGMMFFLIVLVDRVVWSPLVAWSEKFRFDTQRGGERESFVLELLKKSNLLPILEDFRMRLFERLEYIYYVSKRRLAFRPGIFPRFFKIRSLLIIVILFLVLGFVYRGMRGIVLLLGGVSIQTWFLFLRDLLLSFLRVSAATILGSLWAIPAGVYVGTHPKLTKPIQPLVQVIAAFPAPMLFPLLTYFLLKVGLGLQVGSVVLMLFACQWYILFNVISGASSIPSQMFDVADIFHVRGWRLWQSVILPAIFPSLVNGWVTGAGAAWNATIVSEFVLYRGEALTATGIGSAITQAAEAADFPSLAGGILVMVTAVVLLNRFLWGGLYRLSEKRFRMEY